MIALAALLFSGACSLGDAQLLGAGRSIVVAEENFLFDIFGVMLMLTIPLLVGRIYHGIRDRRHRRGNQSHVESQPVPRQRRPL